MKIRNHIIYLTAATATACLTAAYAAEKVRPAVIEALSAKGVTNIQELEKAGDVRIFAGVSGQNPISIYLLKDGNAVVGARIDKNAEPMDVKLVSNAMAQPLNEGIWQQLESSQWIRDGKADAPRVVYVISDPNCPWCHKFWAAARPYVEAGKVQLRHVFVGIIRSDSAAKAAAIFESSNPSETLEQNERAFEKGGIAPLKTISAKSKKTLDANLKLMQQLGFSGTPAILYKLPDGTLGSVNGFPKNNLAEVMGE